MRLYLSDNGLIRQITLDFKKLFLKQEGEGNNLKFIFKYWNNSM